MGEGKKPAAIAIESRAQWRSDVAHYARLFKGGEVGAIAHIGGLAISRPVDDRPPLIEDEQIEQVGIASNALSQKALQAIVLRLLVKNEMALCTLLDETIEAKEYLPA